MKKFILMCFSFGLAISVWAQDRVVTGKVTSSEDGSALPGVNIVVKGTTNGTVTDSDGKYSVSVPSSGATLSFSFIGLETQEVAVGERSIIDVSLVSDVKQLNEVVVTVAGGLQARQRELGMANTVLEPKTLTAGRAVNVANGLQGKVAGLQINATDSGPNPNYSIVLRGARSMTGNNQALIVVDNVIVPNAVLSNLNQNDIESIVIQQGAGAAAIYGSQASNGAVIITTKKGKSGAVEISATQSIQANQVSFYPKFQTKFGSGGSGYGINPDGTPYYSQYENQSYGPAFDGTDKPLGPPQLNGYQDHTTYSYKDGHKKFWDVGLTNQSDLSFSTGTDKSTLYVSGQYVTVTGTTPGDKFTRANLRVNGTTKITDNVKIAYSVLYAPNLYDITYQTATIYDNMLNMPSNVDITKYKNWQAEGYGPQAIGNPNNFYNPWYQNPYFTAANYREKDKNNYLTGNIELKYAPVKGLEFTVRQGISNRETFTNQNQGAFTYTNYAQNTWNSLKTNIPGATSYTTAWSVQAITDFLTQYNKQFSDFHLNAIGGLQLIENQAKYTTTAIGGLVVSGLNNLSNGTGTPAYGQASYLTHLVGVYGKASLSYKDIYFLTGTIRNDWDSRLITSNRSFLYPSAEASVVLSDAIPSLKDNNFISFLKLRAGVSSIGQVNLAGTSTLISNANLAGTFPVPSLTDYGAYKTIPVFSGNTSNGGQNGFPFGTLAGYSVGNQLVSNNLKPEITNQFEFGFDATLWRDRITASATYYQSKTNNQTITTSVSQSTGFSQLLTNIGQTQSDGLELTMNIMALKTDSWTVSVGGNYTYLHNTVNSIGANIPNVTLASSNTGVGGAVSVAQAGQPFPIILGYDYLRDPQGHVIVDGISGVPTQNPNLTILGNGTPRTRIGTNGKVSYKAFSFSVWFEYRGNYSIYNGLGPNMDWSGTSYRTGIYDRKSFVFPNSVIQNSDGTFSANKTVAIANGNGNNGFWSDGINRGVDSNYITSGNFIKLREISLAYDLTPFFRKMGNKVIKGGSISAQGRNLFIWLAKDNYYTDPEYSAAGSTGNGFGINNVAQTPPVRYFGGTLSLKF